MYLKVLGTMRITLLFSRMSSRQQMITAVGQKLRHTLNSRNKFLALIKLEPEQKTHFLVFVLFVIYSNKHPYFILKL